MHTPGSSLAMADLRAATTLWRRAEQACEADWTNLQSIRDADRCWFEVALHALNCGFSNDEPGIEAWVMDRLASQPIWRELGRAYPQSNLHKGY